VAILRVREPSRLSLAVQSVRGVYRQGGTQNTEPAKLGEGGGSPPYRRLVESIGGHVWGCERVGEQIGGGRRRGYGEAAKTLLVKR
jgi:hypothetical protein